MGNSGSRLKGKSSRRDISSAQLLVYGYIRTEIEPLITEQIIPASINQICWMFYDFNHRKLIFCLNKDVCNPQPLYFTYIGRSGGNAWHANFWSQNWKIGDNMGVCSTTGLKKYPKIFSKYQDIWASIVIFVCGHGEAGAYDNQCYCGIFVDTNLLANANTNEKFQSDRWELPHLPLYKLASNSLAFSSKYQVLYSVGGACRTRSSYNSQRLPVNNLYALDFKQDIDNIAAWNWHEMKDAKLGDSRQNSSAVIVEKYDRLFIAGGCNVIQNATSSMLVYDMENEKLIKKGIASAKYGRYHAGIVSNQYNLDEIYVGGGNGHESTKNTVECYNAVKNVWNTVPETKEEYACNPVLWLEDGYKLYIASCQLQCCEFIDLREMKTWKMVHAKEKLLMDLFGMSENTNPSLCRLVTS